MLYRIARTGKSWRKRNYGVHKITNNIIPQIQIVQSGSLVCAT